MNQNLSWKILVAVSLLVQMGCAPKEPGTATSDGSPEAQSEVHLLMQYLSDNGNYVTSRNFPSMIKPGTVFEDAGPAQYIIDLRSPEAFARGHIKNARNVRFSDLPGYFQNDIKPFQFEKIVLVCDHGQLSSYATSLLRLMGYGNVYSMRWGMDCWHPDIAMNNGWEALVSNDYADDLERMVHEKPEPGTFPVLNTGKSSGEEILDARMEHLFKADFKDVWIRPREVFGSPSEYFIINFDRRDKYESGHIPGAIRYKPSGTLGFGDEMLTIPADRDVVLYCGTGQNSAFAVAYLRLLGYRAHSLIYGNNSFMHGKMKAEESNLSWQAFGPEYMHEFPYETGY